MPFNLLHSRDPGLIRFWRATQGALALIVTTAILIGVGQLLNQSFASVVLGVAIALFASIAVNDPSLRAQRITISLLPLPAIFSVTVSAFLADNRVLSDVVFLVIIFGAVCLRWFGPRGFAVGMVLCMAYFFTLFLGVQPSELPVLYLSLIIGIGSVYVMRFMILPSRADLTLKAALRALRLRTAKVLDDAVRNLRVRDDRRFEVWQLRRLAQLNEVSLLIEAHLESYVSPLFDSQKLIKDIFSLELAAEQVLFSSRNITDQDDIKAARPILANLAASFRRGEAVEWQHVTLKQRATRVLYEAAEELNLLVKDLNQLKQYRLKLALINAGAPSNPIGPRPRFKRVAQTATQATLASGLALLAGEILSPSRWYWAVIAAYLSLTGTNSRGEVLFKGWKRVAGTFVGILAGTVVASLVGGNHDLALALIAVCLFLAIYASQIAYSFMTFWITIAVALLYGLIGEFSFDLLGLRLIETLVGASIGILVAFFVFPVKTNQHVRQALAEALVALHGEISAAGPSQHHAEQALSSARTVDKALQNLRDTARPWLTAGWVAAVGKDVRLYLRSLRKTSFFLRQLARSQLDWDKLPSTLRKAAQSVNRSMLHNISVMSHQLTGQINRSAYYDTHKQITRFEATLNDCHVEGSLSASQLRSLRYYLLASLRTDQLLTHLATA